MSIYKTFLIHRQEMSIYIYKTRNVYGHKCGSSNLLVALR